MRLRVLMWCAAAVSGAAASSAALAQNVAVPRQSTDRPAESRTETAPDAHPDRPVQDPRLQQLQPQPTQLGASGQAAPPRGDLLRDHDNSLLKASLAARPDAGQAHLKDVSFYAVPAPEPKVIRKHDLVTIIIREDSSFSSDQTTETKRASDIDAALTDFVQLKLKNFEIQGGGIGPVPPAIKGNFNRNFKGEGTLDRSDKFSARITAEVLDVKPNGTLVLQARKRIKTDEEEQMFTLTGTCRAEDITADNTILSTSLHDQELIKNHKGTVRNASRKGWGGKLLDALSPF